MPGNIASLMNAQNKPCQRYSKGCRLIASSGAQAELRTLHMLMNLGSFGIEAEVDGQCSQFSKTERVQYRRSLDFN